MLFSILRSGSCISFVLEVLSSIAREALELDYSLPTLLSQIICQAHFQVAYNSFELSLSIGHLATYRTRDCPFHVILNRTQSEIQLSYIRVPANKIMEIVAASIFFWFLHSVHLGNDYSKSLWWRNSDSGVGSLLSMPFRRFLGLFLLACFGRA